MLNFIRKTAIVIFIIMFLHSTTLQGLGSSAVTMPKINKHTLKPGATAVMNGTEKVAQELKSANGIITRVLVFNCGSSSIKVQFINLETGENILKTCKNPILQAGKIEKIGEEAADEQEYVADHDEAIAIFLNALQEEGLLESVDAVGHRIVHGGTLTQPTMVFKEGDEADDAVRAHIPHAPLHNGPNRKGYLAIIKFFKEVLGKEPPPQCLVFDTAPHQTIPPRNSTYAIPHQFTERYRIRKWGFHGTSHKFVAGEAAEELGIRWGEFNGVTAHLGNGSSMAYFVDGKVKDTSMGFGPMVGVPMGSRCGDIDLAVVPYLISELTKDVKNGDQKIIALLKEFGINPNNITVESIMHIFNNHSGLLGISGYTNDVKTLLKIEAGTYETNDPKYNEDKENYQKRAKLALQIFVKRVTDYICLYVSRIERKGNKVDVIVFTGGISEAPDREIVKRIKTFLELAFKHHSYAPEMRVVHTNEELVIAQLTKETVERNGKQPASKGASPEDIAATTATTPSTITGTPQSAFFAAPHATTTNLFGEAA